MKPRLTEHPWNDLAFEGGTLVLGTPSSAYMTCPQIVLVGIGGLHGLQSHVPVFWLVRRGDIDRGRGVDRLRTGNDAG